MKVIVTGADGLLGSNLVRLLIESDYEVGAFVEKGKKTPTLDNLDLKIHYGDILDVDTLNEAFEGYDSVIHAAASTSVWPSRSKKVWDINFNGTKNVIEAVQKQKIGRLVAVGTANSFTPGSNEQSGFGCEKYKLDYIDSKYAALKLIREKVANENLPALVIHPTFMIGPYDTTPSSSVMLIRLIEGKIPGYTNGGKSWTYVKDVAQAIVNSLTMGQIGHSYIAGNWNLSYKEFFDLAAATLNVKAPKFYIPRFITLMGGALSSLGAAITKKPPLLSYTMAKIGLDKHYYDSTKAHTELMMSQTPLEVAIKECVNFLVENNMVEYNG